MNSTTASKPGLRGRIRRAVRSELVAVAMDLFLHQGFDATTVDEIAAAAGISRRSFFRYFPSKEEVVLSHLDDVGEALAAALEERPAAEDAWAALRHALEGLIDETERDPEASLARLRMLAGAVALKARYLERQLSWQEHLVPQVAGRLDTAPAPDGGRTDPRAAAVVGAAVACLAAAYEAWMAAGGEARMSDLLDDTMRAVHPGSF